MKNKRQNEIEYLHNLLKSIKLIIVLLLLEVDSF